MSDDAAAPKAEIVIVRRRGGDDGAAVKGGAWKIAYADFVTAMMAFFLVMWLINASNEATRAQVASYFNPIKLTDSSTGNRGLKERKENRTTQKGETQDPPGPSAPSAEDAKSEAEILADPQKALAKVAEEAAAHQEGAAEESQPAAPQPSSGMSDPFDPRSRETVQEHTETNPKNSEERPAAPEASAHPPQPEPVLPIDAGLPAPKLDHRPENKADDAAPESKPAQTANVAKSAADPAVPKPENWSGKQAEVAKQIAGEIAAELGTGLDKLPASIDVKVTDEGILISLTDKHVFGMFKSGSAEPEPQMLTLVDAIARSLARHEGYIVVRGHTDSKPYRNKKYDNWQLSTARAHLAQYMLVRSGLDEKRIRRVEGVADREPRLPDDPQAPENRRIEILLGAGKS